MKHSSGQLFRDFDDLEKKKMEQEIDFAKQNNEYISEKREQLKTLKPKFDQQSKTLKQRSRKFCAVILFMVIVMIGYLIYYFIVNVKDHVFADYFQKREQIKEMVPVGKEKLKEGIERTEEMYKETQETIDVLEERYHQAEETYEKGKEIYDSSQEIVDMINKNGEEEEE